jgi:hypothetical protein
VCSSDLFQGTVNQALRPYPQYTGMFIPDT